MADFISSLNGLQMDNALKAVERHDPEAWAVGQRGSTPVSSTDETFNNNAKYYANSANAAAARAEGAVPAGTAGAVFFDRAQTLTDAQKAQARANIGSANSNPNILLNSWFGTNELMNPYGFTEDWVTQGMSPFPRWTLATSTAESSLLTMTDNCAYLQCNNALWSQFKQKIENPSYINGKTVTLSLLTRDGQVYSGSVTRANGTEQVVASEASGSTVYMNLMFSPSDEVLVAVANYGSVYIRGMKLELGNTSTILYDVPPTIGETTAKVGGYARSNRNLLDNPWWGSGEVVNQRSVTSGSTNNAYTIDRWIWSTGTGGASWSLGANGVTLTPVASSAGIWFQQQLPSNVWNYIIGKRCTGSVLLSDGTIRSGSVVISTSANSYFWHTGDMEVYCGTSGKFLVYEKNTAVTIRAAKLELGSYSTLINDTPPIPAEELAKCQYYYREIKCTTTGYAMIGFATAATAFQACLPYVMRVRPTITYSGTLNAYYAGGNSPVTAVAANGEFTNSIQVAFTTSGLTAGSIVALAMGSGAKLMFSADL